MKLIVVSNRGPVTYARDASGARVARRGGGGLVTALRGLLSHHDVTWIASAAGPEDRAVAQEAGGSLEETSRDGSRYRLRLVAHDPGAYDRFYNAVANPLLWFVHHYLWGLGDRPDVDRVVWSGYEEVNRGFADAVLEELEREPDARVFFHDYHLYLAPGHVRRARPEALLAHFVHVPWPQSDYWHVLPEHCRRAVHEGLLANDVVGFHTERWRRNFARTCADLLGATVDNATGRTNTVVHEGHRTRAVAHGISIDPAEFEELAASEQVRTAGTTLHERRTEQVILRVDRTDPSKNIVRGFRALALLLDEHPEHRGRITMLALLDPSRQDIPEYLEYRASIERTAAEVNDRFGTPEWQPVDLRIRDDFPQTLAAYLDYDVLFVNAVYDGMNLIAKEAPLVNRRDGPVVLSENAGAHEEIGAWTLTVNPFDVRGQADALHRALTMGADERRARAEAIRAHVRAHDVQRWVALQLEDLDRVTLCR
jgi:trehalose 6-phosphate synthase